MTILQGLSSTVDVILCPGLTTWLHVYITNIIIHYRRLIMSWVNCMTNLITLSATIDANLDHGLITWTSY
jgi:hypothetical protein